MRFLAKVDLISKPEHDIEL